MNVDIGTVTEEPRALHKRMTAVASLTGTLREASSVITPSILVQASANTIATCNYMYIPEFHRYYFITDVTAYNNKLSVVTGKCDVLNTYAGQIVDNQAIVKRSANAGDPFINDGSMRVRTTKTFTPYMFGKQFTDYSYILVTI